MNTVGKYLLFHSDIWPYSLKLFSVRFIYNWMVWRPHRLLNLQIDRISRQGSSSQQECIPVGCVPLAQWPSGGGVKTRKKLITQTPYIVWYIVCDLYWEHIIHRNCRVEIFDIYKVSEFDIKWYILKTDFLFNFDVLVLLPCVIITKLDLQRVLELWYWSYSYDCDLVFAIAIIVQSWSE